MSQALSPMQEALLRCCANPEGEHCELVSALENASEGEAAHLVALTRTGPLLESCIGRTGMAATLLKDDLAGISRGQTLIALSQARGLVRATRLLDDAGIESIALKGAALAHRDYPAPQLRPLRDLDLLVRPEQAEAAHALLLAHPAYCKPDWAGPYGIDYGHQLPEIVDQESGVVIEIHHRLNAREWAGEAQLLEAMWRDEEQIELFGMPVRVPSTQANLLHLIEHASLHHGFSNGPLILADLHFIATRERSDWGAVIGAAGRMGLARALLLTAEVAHQFGAQWVPACIVEQAQGSSPFALAAAIAMFAGHDEAERHEQLRRLSRRSAGSSGIGAAFARIARPERHQLAQFSGQSPHGALRWLGYPAWLLAKGGQYWRSRRDRAFMAQHRQRSAMLDWVAQPE